MENRQAFDSKLNEPEVRERNGWVNPLILTFLNKKILEKKLNEQESYLAKSVSTQNSNQNIQELKYIFKVIRYEINKNVDFIIELERILKNKDYLPTLRFRTRFSLLQNFYEKLNFQLEKKKITNKLKFPEKRWFGNKKKSFIQKRKTEIQKFLNQVARYYQNLQTFQDLFNQIVRISQVQSQTLNL